MIPWASLPNGLQRRVYPSYDAYVAHQGAKLGRLPASKLQARDARLMAALRLRLPQPTDHASPAVLCLGARTGAEVRVFRSLGYRACGVDVQPGSIDVLPGDFHHLQFTDGSFDFVFTNALDHAYNLEQVLSECRRVLKPHGTLWLEVVRGTMEGCSAGTYECLAWTTIDLFVSVIESHGWTCEQRLAFDSPWLGEALVCH